MSLIMTLTLPCERGEPITRQTSAMYCTQETTATYGWRYLRTFISTVMAPFALEQVSANPHHMGRYDTVAIGRVCPETVPAVWSVTFRCVVVLCDCGVPLINHFSCTPSYCHHCTCVISHVAFVTWLQYSARALTTMTFIMTISLGLLNTFSIKVPILLSLQLKKTILNFMVVNIKPNVEPAMKPYYVFLLL